jgi:catalase
VAEDGWEVDGEMVRAAYALRADDDDFGQAGTLVREVWDDAARERFVSNVAGHILGGVKPETLPRVLEYWKKVDADTGKKIEELVQAGLPQDGPAPSPTERRGLIEETTRSHAG